MGWRGIDGVASRREGSRIMWEFIKEPENAGGVAGSMVGWQVLERVVELCWEFI